MQILIVAIEAGRWGPSRLPAAFRAAGLSVAALCPDDNALAATDYLDCHFSLPPSRSSQRMAQALANAIASCRPQLIVPGDEQVVALLHALVRQGPTRVLDSAALDLIVRSLGKPEHLDAMLLKSDTLDMARRLGVRVPAGGRCASVDAAARDAGAIGYPVYVKSSFGWAGRGVTRCDDEMALRAAMTVPPDRLAIVKGWVRALMKRDWYPNATAVDVQQAIAGHPAMYCALAWEGRLLGGFAGIPSATAGANGPSTALWIGSHRIMEEAAKKMIAGMGATGFIGFDFMIEATTGQAYLLECNPRPIQVCHLGERVGVDLARILADALNGVTGVTESPNLLAGLEVALFPHALQISADDTSILRDIPWQDSGLLRFFGRDDAAIQAVIAGQITSPIGASPRHSLTGTG